MQYCTSNGSQLTDPHLKSFFGVRRELANRREVRVRHLREAHKGIIQIRLLCNLH